MSWVISTILKLSVSIKNSIPNMIIKNSNRSSSTLLICSVLSGITIINLWILKRNQKRKMTLLIEEMRKKRLIVITGCDSGLGLSMAYWGGKLGYKILAGCLDKNGEGANFLSQELGDSSCKIVQLDVTKIESLKNFKDQCKAIIENDAGGGPIELWALIPNAAIGCFGEFFWLTHGQEHQIMDVNFWGSVNLTKQFESLLLQHKSRLVVISSDCADYALPGLAMYSASKAALQTWATSLRLEVGKYGVSVVSFQPGSFPMTSRLFARQHVHYEEMKKEMSMEKFEFYGEYFHKVNGALVKLFSDNPSKIAPLEDKNIKKHFIALMEEDIQYKSLMIYDPPIVRIFHFLLRNCTTKFCDLLIVKLLKYPQWKSKDTLVPSQNVKS